MDNKEYQEYLEALQSIFKGESGKKIIKFLKRAYVDSRALDEKPELTYYKLGQKEFVQGLIQDIERDPKEFENIGGNYE